MPRKLLEVGEREAVARAAEAVEPLQHIGGVARLRHFAVVDDVDAGLDLLARRLEHRLGDPALERRRIDLVAALRRDDHLDQIVRPRQAAGMGGQEPVDAVHGLLRFA